MANTVWYQAGDVGSAVQGGQARAGLDLDLVLNLAAASYTFGTPVLGGRNTVAALVPFADLRAEGHDVG